MKRKRNWSQVLASLARVVLVCSVLSQGQASAQVTPRGTSVQRPVLNSAMRTYKTRYYSLCTDVGNQMIWEAAARLKAMAEEYARRTRGFSGAIRYRMPFYLFRNQADYLAAGGPAGTAGCFLRITRAGEFSVHRSGHLMAWLGERPTDRFWHTVQHEGFHQFSHMIIQGRLPVWLEEGLAEYFGESIWTGDSLVTGIIRPERLRKVQAAITGNKLLAFADMVTMSYREWSLGRHPHQYDQAWSMVHFLVHGDNGKYRLALVGFISDMAKARPLAQAFIRRFGTNMVAFEKRYARWWLGLLEEATRERYTFATVETLTSFLARATAQKQYFKNVEEFLQAAQRGEVKCNPKQWLPPKLLKDAAEQAGRLKVWSLQGLAISPKLVLSVPGGATFRGTFTVKANGDIVPKVTVTENKRTSSKGDLYISPIPGVLIKKPEE